VKDNTTLKGPIGIIVVLLLEVILYALVMAIFLIEGGWILIAEIILGAAAVIYMKKNRKVSGQLKEIFSMHKTAAWIGLFILLILVPFLLQSSAYWIFVIVNAGMFLLACIGLNMQLGSTGMMNLAGSAFMAFGAYTAGLLAINFGWPAWATLLAGALVTGLFSIILFIPVLKTKGHYLALVTIAFQFMVVILAENMEWTGGPQGLKNIPLLSFFGYSFNNDLNLGFVTLSKYANFYYLLIAILAVVLVAANRIYHSWVGVTLSTIRDDEVAAQTNGVRVNYWKLIIFVIGNCLIGLSGAYFAHLIGFISPPNFSFDRSLVMVSIVILGGMDNIIGIILGSLLLIILPEKLRVIQDIRFLVYGLVLIVMLIFQPKGIVPFVPRDYKGLLSRIKKPDQVLPREVAEGVKNEQ
jgi:ABC-type branched-subunit amino acid transport system permease subunit